MLQSTYLLKRLFFFPNVCSILLHIFGLVFLSKFYKKSMRKLVCFFTYPCSILLHICQKACSSFLILVPCFYISATKVGLLYLSLFNASTIFTPPKQLGLPYLFLFHASTYLLESLVFFTYLWSILLSLLEAWFSFLILVLFFYMSARKLDLLFLSLFHSSTYLLETWSSLLILVPFHWISAGS